MATSTPTAGTVTGNTLGSGLATLEFRHLAALDAVAEEGTFGRAADLAPREAEYFQLAG